MAAFVPVPFCSHSLMDRISDSGSDGLGSNPDGSTKNAFVGVYRPYRARKEARFCRRPCLFSYFVLFHEFGRASGNHGYQTYVREMKDSMYGCRPGHADRYAQLGRSFPPHARLAKAGSLQAIWFRENVLGGTKRMSQSVLSCENVLYGTKQHCSRM